jgi:hypothetical protein
MDRYDHAMQFRQKASLKIKKMNIQDYTDFEEFRAMIEQLDGRWLLNGGNGQTARPPPTDASGGRMRSTQGAMTL